MFARHLVQGWLDLIAPACCPGCDSWLQEPLLFCEACRPLLERLPFRSATPPPLGCAFLYGGPLADAICKLKYKSRTDLSGTLGALLTDAALPYRGIVDTVIPVPLYPKRLRTRGFNQSALLAASVAKALSIPMSVSVLARVRDTLPQTELDWARRASNVRGAFKATAASSKRRVLLVDDVTTTGATLSEAAMALRAAGAEQVYCLALAKAELT